MPDSPEKEFRDAVREHIVEWYSGCPRAIQFTNSIVKEYKSKFPDDDLLAEVAKRAKSGK